jgi:hypothetical protein
VAKKEETYKGKQNTKMFKFPTLFGMKKEPLFDDHQIRKTKKPNTTEKVHGFILTKKMRKFLDDPKIENVLDKLIELSYKKNYGLLLIQQSLYKTFKQRTKKKKT